MSTDQSAEAAPARRSWRTALHSGPLGRGPLRGIVETVVLLVIAICLALVVKTFFVQAFYIPSGSMEPALQGGPGIATPDRILVEKPSYWFGSPQRGDIVVFSDPGGWLDAEEDAPPSSGVGKVLAHIGLYPTGGHLVKRVIGVGGDTVSCCSTDGKLEVNGTAIDESSFVQLDGNSCDGPMRQDDGSSSKGGCDGWSATVPDGKLFVMGDNRGNSADSSYHLCSPAHARDPSYADQCADAFVPESDVVGKVVALVWPADRFKFLHRPAAFAQIPAP